MSTATTPYINVTEVEYVGGYRLRIAFSDGHESVVDFEPFLRKSYHPDIQKYLDLGLFRRWTIDHGNLYWNDYDLIFPTSDLYAGHIS
jgi:hypothetical protein